MATFNQTYSYVSWHLNIGGSSFADTIQLWVNSSSSGGYTFSGKQFIEKDNPRPKIVK